MTQRRNPQLFVVSAGRSCYGVLGSGNDSGARARRRRRGFGGAGRRARGLVAALSMPAAQVAAAMGESTIVGSAATGPSIRLTAPPPTILAASQSG